MNFYRKYKGKAISSLAVTVTLLICLNLHFTMKNRSKALSRLSATDNISVSFTPPTWINKVPKFIANYLKQSFPANIDFNSQATLSILIDDKDDSETISLKDFLDEIAHVGKINELTINLSESSADSLLYLDDIFALTEPIKLRIQADRIALKKKHRALNKLTELSIHANDIAPSILDSLTHCHHLKKLSLKSANFIKKKHLKLIEPHTGLTSLTLEDTKCSGDDLAFLKNMTQLTQLNLGTPTQTLQKGANSTEQVLGKYYDLSQHVEFISGLQQLTRLDANITLSKTNLQLLCRLQKIPVAYYDLPAVIDDKFLMLLDTFLSKASEEYLKLGIVDKLSIAGQKSITDKSLPFFQKYSPKTMDFRGTSISKVETLALEKYRTVHFSTKSYKKVIIKRLNRDEYELLDFSNTSFDDDDLKMLLQKSKVRVLILHNTKISDLAIDILMEFFDNYPKERVKVSFGDRDIPEDKRKLFLSRVHQWGMRQVFSSHLDKDITFPTWAVHTSKKVIHDRLGYLLNLHEYFPQLSTINLNGLPLNKKEWYDLGKLTKLRSISINSPQNGQHIIASDILSKILSIEINTPPLSPIGLKNNLESCRIYLPQNKSLKDFIDFQHPCAQELIIDGHGTVDLALLSQAQGLKSLTIGPFIKLQNNFTKLPSLEYLNCMAQASPEVLVSVAQLSSLKKLICECEHLNADTLNKWSSLSQLSSLDLSSADLNDQQLTSISHFTALEILNLPANEAVTVAILKELKKNQSLIKLGINGTSIPSTDCHELYETPLLWDFLP